jgi:hypothetical protein
MLCRPEYVDAQGFEALGMGGSALAAMHRKGGISLSPELMAQLQQAQQQQQKQQQIGAQGRVAAEALQQLLSKDQVCCLFCCRDAV